ncbi:nitroreductase family protein [Colwellia psychrerythraea]|uniref:Putative NAD(P)H nitroreductase n=1 Tax=Colwellia psychrerythraea TaxID=28229 RepID=A0A099KUH2_COLPS|nr:nitroreductase family protein [Colwellia psychrerythraea]KGJ93845.1 nitroreductase [Colwellia psychrerythraea]
MNAIELLLQRQSTPLLTEPAPTEADLSTLLSAGMRVPDHAGLKPWYFHVITGQGLQRLSDLYVEATTEDLSSMAGLIEGTTIDEHAFNEKIAKVEKMPFRAPMIIVISTQYIDHNKVPEQEQLVAAGCTAQAMQMAAFALGYGAMWRTGDLAYNEIVKHGLAIEEGNEIIGFLYIGTPTKAINAKPAKDYQNKVTYWQ